MTFAEPNNVTGLYDMFVYSDSVTGGWVSLGILISLYLIVSLYLIFSGEEFWSSTTVAGFLTGFISVLFYLMGLISGAYFASFVVLCAIPLVVTFVKNS